MFFIVLVNIPPYSFGAQGSLGAMFPGVPVHVWVSGRNGQKLSLGVTWEVRPAFIPDLGLQTQGATSGCETPRQLPVPLQIPGCGLRGQGGLLGAT
jgi:hypothetical protein